MMLLDTSSFRKWGKAVDGEVMIIESSVINISSKLHLDMHKDISVDREAMIVWINRELGSGRVTFRSSSRDMPPCKVHKISGDSFLSDKRTIGEVILAFFSL